MLKKRQTSPVCCLPLEVKVRDLDPRLFLGLKCVREGYGCLIGSKPGVDGAMFDLDRAPIFFDKGMSVDNDAFYDRLFQAGGGLVLLAEEGGVYPQSYQWVVVAYDKPRIQEVDLVCMWGALQRDMLLAARPDLDPSRLPVTGHPRFDMRKPGFNPFYAGVNPVPVAHKPYILCNSNFSVANNPMPFEELCAFYDQLYANSPHKQEANLRPYLEYEQALLPFFVDTLTEAAARRPDLTIIYRPHPAEDPGFYDRAFAGVPNIVINTDGSVQEWIIHAEMVVHHDCTTAVEALFNGVRAVSLAPIVNPEIAKEVPLLVSDVCRDKAEFLAFADRAGSGSMRLTEEERSTRLGQVEKIIANTGFDSGEAIVAALPAVVERMRARGHTRPQTSRLRRIVRRMTTALAKPSGTAKFPGLTRSELQRRVDLLRGIDASLPPVRIEPRGPHTFLLEASTKQG